MLTLVLDTSAGTAVALVDIDERAGGAGARVLAHEATSDPRRHAEELSPMVERALRGVGADPSALGAVVVGTGPAPFTGLRVGLVTARTIAHARGIPLFGVPSLDALGRTVLDALHGEGLDVAVATDARRREVYAARYRSHGPQDVRAVVAPFVAAPAAARAELGLGEGVPLAGAATGLYPDDLPGDEHLPSQIDLAAMARVAFARRAAHDHGDAGVPPLDTEPLYLRRPDIHEGGASR